MFWFTFLFLDFFYKLFILLLQLLAAVINLSLFIYSLSISPSTQSSMFASPFPPFFLSHRQLCIVINFMFYCPSVQVLPLSSLRSVQSILQESQSKYLFLWSNFCCRDWFQEVFLLFTSMLDSNYTQMLRVILNKSWRQHPTRHQLYGHLPPITKTI